MCKQPALLSKLCVEHQRRKKDRHLKRNKPVLICWYCKQHFQAKELLVIHIKLEHGRVLYSNPDLIWYGCNICCDKLYMRIQDIVKHMRNIHGKLDIQVEDYVVQSMQDITWTCVKCDKLCILAKTCLEHKEKAKVDKWDDLERKVCSFVAKSNKELSEDLCSSCCTELNSHIGKRTNQYLSCYYCDEIFAEKSTLQLHMKILHPDGNMSHRSSVLRWYTCRDCPSKLYRKTQGIIYHMRVRHDKYNIDPEQYAVKSLQDIMYWCNVCSQRCYLSATCSIHRPSNSKGQYRMSVSISNECDQHVECHTCNECDSKHNDCQSLWDHVFSEHKDMLAFKCNLCLSDKSAATNKRSVITRHMSQVHNKSLIFSKPDDSENKINKVAEKQYWKDVEEKCRIIVEGVLRCGHVVHVRQSSPHNRVSAHTLLLMQNLTKNCQKTCVPLAVLT
ncbi:hypothetical protein M8J76_004509 [Diaphorina citri]|nr:hypothetical protein M8J76_004509 [Diaphorina citri]